MTPADRRAAAERRLLAALRRPPLLLCVALAVAYALVGHLTGWWPAGAGAPDDGPRLAFWQFIILAAELIWKGIEVAGKVTLIALQWSVHALWWFARTIASFAKDAAKLFVKGFRETWEFFSRHVYPVLKKGWQNFWKFVDWAKRSLDNLFRPVFKLLNRFRSELLGFYTKYVRPILDTIGIARHVLRVLQTFGVDWARALDAKLANLEAMIDRPFRLLLAEINKVIAVVNRIVTVDGLFQRLTLLRSVERDIRQLSSSFRAWRSAPLTAADYEARRQQAGARTIAHVQADLTAALVRDDGPYASFADEMVPQWARYLGV